MRLAAIEFIFGVITRHVEVNPSATINRFIRERLGFTGKRCGVVLEISGGRRAIGKPSAERIFTVRFYALRRDFYFLAFKRSTPAFTK
jgi:hypothetical protein